jgi:hypothetical protein
MIMISSKRGDCKLADSGSEALTNQDSIVCGLYINITLHDYLRTIVNLNSTNSTWTLVGRKLLRGVERQTKMCHGLLFILEPI